MRAFIYGATGAVGRECLDLLISETRYSEVHVLARRSPDLAGRTDKVTLHLSEFDRFIEFGQMPEVDHVFCALGTTIKIAGSQDAFRMIDYTYVLRIAEKARVAGASRFVLVSAVGASTKSKFFYNRVKGKIEEAVADLGFESTILVRPSLIIGNREESRPGERFAAPFLRLAPRTYRPVKSNAIATCMIREINGPTGLRVILSRDIA